MTEKETLRYARNVLLSLHKQFVDFERTRYEQLHGAVTAGQFLNVLLEDGSFSWLRKFSMLIVEIDEMFDLKDGMTDDMIAASLKKMRELVTMTDADENFSARYQFALQNSKDASNTQEQLQAILSVD